MIVNLKSQSNLSGLYVVYEGSTNIEKKGKFRYFTSYGTFDV